MTQNGLAAPLISGKPQRSIWRKTPAGINIRFQLLGNHWLSHDSDQTSEFHGTLLGLPCRLIHG